MNNNINSNGQKDDVLDLHVLLRDALNIVKKIWWISLAVFVLLALLFCGYQKYSYVPTYESKASFTVNTTTSYAEVAASYGFYYDSANAEQMAKVLPYILKSSVFNEVLKEELGTDRVNGTITLSAIKDSNLFSISVVSTDPEDAKAVLDAAVKRLPDVSRYVIGETKLNIIQPSAVPTSPNNPINYFLSVLICFAVTFVISAIAVVILALFRKTIQSEQDFRNQLNMVCMGVVPFKKSAKKKKNNKKNKKDEAPFIIDTSSESGKHIAERMKSIALKVTRAMNKSGDKVLMVTAAMVNEGKSSVAMNLARYIKLGEPDKKVALIDLDLRKCSVSKIAEKQKNFCPINKLIGEQKTVKKAFGDRKVLVIQSEGSPKRIKRLFDENPNDVVIFGSDTPSKNPEKKLDSDGMRDLIEEIKKNADYVIIDTPPCAITADPLLISDYCDGILFVIRQDSTHRWTILDCMNNVSSRGCKIIGGVLNAAKDSILDAGYGYGKYGRYGRYGKYGYRNRYGYGYGYGYGKYGYSEDEERIEERR